MSRSIFVALSAAILAIIGAAVVLLRYGGATARTEPTHYPDGESTQALAGSPAGSEVMREIPNTSASAGTAEEPAPVGLKSVVRFPDGSTVPLTLRAIGEIPTIPKPERLADVHGDFAQRAQAGDGVAARMLHTWLRQCRPVFADAESLERAITLLRSQRIVTSADGRPPRRLRPGVSVEDVERSEFRDRFAFCEGVTAEQKQEAETWLELGAKAGDYKAMESWAAHKKNTQEAVDSLEALWHDGYATVLAGLAIKYGKGVGGRPPDYVRSYALSLLNLKLHEAAYEGSGSARHRRNLIALEDVLHGKEGYLSPQETQEAIALARVLLSENLNCCRGIWF